MTPQAIRRELVWRWRARRIGLYMLGVSLGLLAFPVCFIGLVLLLGLLGLGGEKGRLFGR